MVRRDAFKLALFLICFTISTMGDDKTSINSGSNHSSKTIEIKQRKTENKDRKLFLITVIWPDTIKREEVPDGKLLPNRVYIRWEPRFFVLDNEGKRIFGGYGIDITDENGKFVEKIHQSTGKAVTRLYRPGTVIPGAFLGDPSGKNYVFTEDVHLKLAERWKPTDALLEKLYMQFVPDGTVIQTTEHNSSATRSPIDRP